MESFMLVVAVFFLLVLIPTLLSPTLSGILALLMLFSLGSFTMNWYRRIEGRGRSGSRRRRRR